MATTTERRPWKIYKLRQYTRRKTRPYYTIAIAIASFIGCVAIVLDYALATGNDHVSAISLHHISKRSVNSTNSTTVALEKPSTLPSVGNYPEDLFTLKQLRQGAVLLHTAGMIYMFIALAIVCDEFFVPALEVITDKLQLTEDVAGATFMAAGGSAPEFFTSISGLFISEDSVGISTIIGSAVFNILFVIGACGLAAKQLLHLTWWPLFRDSIFYSVSLMVLIVSYLDWKIHYYEALVLLLCYALYVTFMYFNERIENKVKTVLCRQPARNSNVDLVPTRSRPSSSLKFRAGLLQLMIHTIDPLAEGNIEDQASQLRTIATRKKPAEQPTTPTSGTDQNGNKQDAVRMRNGSARVHSAMGSNTSNHSSMTAVESIEDDNFNTENATPKPSPVKVTKVDTTAATNGVNVQVRTTTNIDSQQPSNSPAVDDDEHENEPLDLSWPKTHRKRFSYIMLAPIIFPLYLTLPDTRRPEKRKYYPITFLGSIIWIAGFAIMMVWWASVICITIGMPVDTIGLTVLAAGTSVPDLLTSVIVARKGFGDMAISSSIGSNIFDITVGLPLPWFLGCLMRIPEPFVKVDAKSLLCSIILLFCMLLFVIGTVAAFRWKLTKMMGVVYIMFYFGFLAVSVLLSYKLIPCIEINFG